MTRLNSTRADLSAWIAEAMRLTTFHSSLDLSALAGSWEKVTGETPEAVNSKPKQGVLSQSGPVDGTLLVFQAQALPQGGKVDWIILPHPQSGKECSLQDLAGIMQRIAPRWLERTPFARRLAFGSINKMRFDSTDSSNLEASKYLNFDIPVGATDFLFQINRPRDSATVSGLTINRLSKWMTTHTVEQTLSVKDGGTLLLSPDAVDGILLQVELDVNTHQSYELDDKADMFEKVFQELLDMSQEILRDGDVS